MGSKLAFYTWLNSFQVTDPEYGEVVGQFTFDQRDVEAARADAISAVKGLCAATPDWRYREADERALVAKKLRDAGVALVRALAAGRHEELISLLQNVRHVRCEVDIHLPWEFLYLGDDDAPFSPTNFLGSRAVIGRPFSRSAERSRIHPDSLDLSDCPIVQSPDEVEQVFGYAEDRRLPSAKNGREEGVFADLGIPIKKLTSLTRSAGAPAELSNFLAESEWLTHFNCHADPEDPYSHQPTRGAIYVSEQYKIDCKGIDATEVCEKSVIVLNCCSGHTMLHGLKDTVATRFAQKRVDAVVATTAAIEDAYATEWARHFYKALRGGAYVPEAILRARETMLSEVDANLSAMLYAYLGKETAHLPGAARKAA